MQKVISVKINVPLKKNSTVKLNSKSVKDRQYTQTAVPTHHCLDKSHNWVLVHLSKSLGAVWLWPREVQKQEGWHSKSVQL